MAAGPTINVRLHARQGTAFESPATEILYGGSAGGGKSLLMRVAAIAWCAIIPKLQVYLFRRLRDDLVKNHVEGPSGFRILLAPWLLAGKCEMVEDEIRFWNGSKIYLCHCKDEKDRYKYLGAEIHVLLIDELTTFSEVIYRFLRSRVRMAGIDVPTPHAGCFPRIVCSSNPGNLGHQWVKAAFIDPRPAMAVERMAPSEGGMLRQFIPARLADNPSINPHEYASKLEGLGNEALVRAMLDGDWNVVAGAFFPEFSSDRHIIEPCALPAYWHRFRAFDWGSARPFSVGWYAVSDGELADFPRGALIRYREWYGAKRDAAGVTIPNAGLRLTAEEVADGIVEREREDVYGSRTMSGVADPSIFAENGGPSLADRMAARKCFFRPADNTRVSQLGAAGGWDQVRARLKGDGEKPGLFIFSTCRDLIRTLPAVQHDEGRPEDIDCWVAGTMVATPDGPRAIESIRPGDVVDTPIGPRPVLRSYLSGASETVCVRFSDGRELRGTAHHKIGIRGRGLVALSDLSCYDTPQERIKWSRSLNIAVSSIAAMKGAFTTMRGLVGRACIARLGLMLAETFQPAITFTTGMATTTITPWRTLNAFRGPSIPACTWSNASAVNLDGRSRTGVGRMPDAPSYARMRARWSSARLSGNVRADIVAFLSGLDILRSRFARLLALMLCPMRLARSAPSHSAASPIRPSACGPVHIVAVGRSEERTPVYNLTVADAHLFYANGVLSSNTDAEDHAADELRYACLSRPYAAPLPPDADEPERDRYARAWKPKRVRGSAMAA
jgi:Terminase large subunit, T4likevirus-type, N-terminal